MHQDLVLCVSTVPHVGAGQEAVCMLVRAPTGRQGPDDIPSDAPFAEALWCCSSHHTYAQSGRTLLNYPMRWRRCFQAHTCC